MHVDTSGWGYPSWQPGFYPAGHDRTAFLSFYAEHLDAVELNATKYRLPSEEQFRSWGAQPGSTVLRDREALVRVVRTCGEGSIQAGGLDDPFPARSAPSGWGPPDREETDPSRTGSGLASRARCNARAKRWNQAQVPTRFRFAVKAPDGIESRRGVFEERVRALGDRLGCVRVVVERPRDDRFLDLLLGSSDPGIRYALDLRDPTWDGVEERLAEAGAVRVGDTTGRAGWAYLRFRELRYGTEQLDRIASELRELARAHVETFAFFRHGERPDAPAAAVQVATACRLT